MAQAQTTRAGHRFEPTRGLKLGIMLHLTHPTVILPLNKRLACFYATCCEGEHTTCTHGAPIRTRSCSP